MKHLPLVTVIVLVSALGACSGQNSTIRALRNEKIIAFVPEGLEDHGITDMPPALSDRRTWIVRTFTARSDETLLKACSDYYGRAIDDGWTGPAPSDPGKSGITGTTMEKGDLELDISCGTTDSFDQFEHDEDKIRLSARIITG